MVPVGDGAVETGDDAAMVVTDGAGAAVESGGDARSDAAADDAATEAAASFPYAFVRVANWSPDAPAIDACLALHGTSNFIGPLVYGAADGGTLALGDSGAPGLSFPLVGSYQLVPPGTYDVRFVAAGATNCNAAVLPAPPTLPALARGAAMTVALVGEAFPVGTDPALQVIAFPDENVNPGGPLRVRFINASPGMSLAAFGTGSLVITSVGVPSFNTMFPAVPFGHAGAAYEQDAMVSNADDDGYVAIQNFNQEVLSVHPTGATMDTLVTMPTSSVAGVVMTVIAVGGTSGGVPTSLIGCFDGAATVGPLSDCNRL